jgi:hypothetical protein
VQPLPRHPEPAGCRAAGGHTSTRAPRTPPDASRHRAPLRAGRLARGILAEGRARHCNVLYLVCSLVDLPDLGVAVDGLEWIRPVRCGKFLDDPVPAG